MIESLKRAFSAYSRNPLPFVWGSVMYLLLSAVFLFASIGLLLLYFLSMSVFNQAVDPGSIGTIAFVGVVGILFAFILSGLNAALARDYRSGLWKEKMSLTKFFSYAIDKAPSAFVIVLIQGFVLLVLAGPAIAVYVLFLRGVDFVDIALWMYLLVVTFIVSLLFTPAIVYNGAVGLDIVSSFKRSVRLFTHKHINFIGLFIVFSIAFALNFVPLVQLVSIFFLYPVTYTAMISMMENGARMDTEEGD